MEKNSNVEEEADNSDGDWIQLMEKDAESLKILEKVSAVWSTLRFKLFKGAQNSFWWVSLATLHQLMLKSSCKENCPRSYNSIDQVPIISWRIGLPQQQYDLLKEPRSRFQGVII